MYWELTDLCRPRSSSTRFLKGTKLILLAKFVPVKESVGINMWEIPTEWRGLEAASEQYQQAHHRRDHGFLWNLKRVQQPFEQKQKEKNRISFAGTNILLNTPFFSPFQLLFFPHFFFFFHFPLKVWMNRPLQVIHVFFFFQYSKSLFLKLITKSLTYSFRFCSTRFMSHPFLLDFDIVSSPSI